MRRARIPELYEHVEFGKLATDKRLIGLKGQVVKIDPNFVTKYDPLGRLNGHDRTDLYVLVPRLRYNGKHVVIRASPFELDGGILNS